MHLQNHRFYRIGKANLELTTPSPHPPSKDSIIQTFGPKTINLLQNEKLNSLIIYFLELIQILKVYLQ